jgi:allophanate hydrolase subunit 2
MGLKLRALKEVVIAVTGGDLSPTLNGERLEMWRTHLLIEGDTLHFKRVRSGCRAYLAIGGGIIVPEIMGSKSTYLSGKLAGWKEGLYDEEIRSTHRPFQRLSTDWVCVFPVIGSPLWKRKCF